jgi:hypothetical protein
MLSRDRAARSAGALGVAVLVAVLPGCGSHPTTPSGLEARGSARTPNPVVPAYCGSYPAAAGPGQWQSARASYVSGRLAYASDAEQNRIPDYSYAGYRYGEQPVPNVPEVARLGPAPGDNTARIQQALDQVGARTPDAAGIRGALALEPGLYEIQGVLRINRSGVVLRGSGDGGDPGRDTILLGIGDSPHQRTLVVLGSGNTSWNEVAPRSNVATPLVTVGSLSLDVESASGFAVGDYVVVKHPSSQAWIDAVDGGGTVTEPKWRPGQIDIPYYRRIVGLRGNTLSLDAPVFNHLNRSLSVSYVTKVTTSAITDAGVESLRVDIVTKGGEDEDHAWSALGVSGAHDSWVRRVTALHFGYAGVVLTGAVRISVEDCRAVDPVGIRTGGRFYNFSTDSRSQLSLFTRCEAADGRHSFISNGTSSASGNVFYRCRALRGGDSEAGHRQWTTGMLYDNLQEAASGQVLLINRGDFGTSHGWGTAHSTVWRYNSGMAVQKPPTGQNYGVSDVGFFRSSYSFPGPPGYTELRAGTLVPQSLYEAQLCERLR